MHVRPQTDQVRTLWNSVTGTDFLLLVGRDVHLKDVLGIENTALAMQLLVFTRKVDVDVLLQRRILRGQVERMAVPNHDTFD